MATVSIDGNLRGIARVIANPPRLSPEDVRRLPVITRSHGILTLSAPSASTTDQGSSVSGDSGLHGVRVPLSKKIYASRDDGRVTGGRPLSADELAEMNAYKAQTAKMEAEFKKRQEEVDAQNNLQCHDTYLPNITNLDLESAIKMKGFVEVDIEQGLDGVGNIFGNYGDKPVSSLKDYLFLLNGYIAEKSGTTAPPTPAQASKPPETTPPTVETPPVATLPDIASTQFPSEPVVGADPNWTDPVGEPGQNHIFFPNVASLSRETAAAVYRQVSDMVKTQDTSSSVIHARNGSAGTYSVDTYMSWLAQRAAIDIEA